MGDSRWGNPESVTDILYMGPHIICKLYNYIYIYKYFIYQTKARGVELYICNASCLINKTTKHEDLLFPWAKIVAPYCHPSTPSSMVTAGNQGDWSFKYPPRRSIALCSGMWLGGTWLDKKLRWTCWWSEKDTVLWMICDIWYYCDTGFMVRFFHTTEPES